MIGVYNLHVNRYDIMARIDVAYSTQTGLPLSPNAHGTDLPVCLLTTEIRDIMTRFSVAA